VARLGGVQTRAMDQLEGTAHLGRVQIVAVAVGVRASTVGRDEARSHNALSTMCCAANDVTINLA
jgi:hypothetical protein